MTEGRPEHNLRIIAASSILSGAPRSSAPHECQAGGVGADDGGRDQRGTSKDRGGGVTHRRQGPAGPDYALLAWAAPVSGTPAQINPPHALDSWTPADATRAGRHNTSTHLRRRTQGGPNRPTAVVQASVTVWPARGAR